MLSESLFMFCGTLGVFSLRWLPLEKWFGCYLSTPLFEEQKRLCLLMALALFQGASIRPLIDLAIAIDPSLIVSTFVWQLLWLLHREYLHLGGLLSSRLSILMWLPFASSPFWGFNNTI
ncbi:hypothetical protein GYH30_032808 [Glycine max]|uniref:Uncharacterized protein n=1 Tax=Glycine max TaxID=3847 RepID=A0A0R0HED2_SOYBN|nr:hypothetical protein GYH30_032808 [Glycine max]